MNSISTFHDFEGEHIEDTDTDVGLFGFGALGDLVVTSEQNHEQCSQELRLSDDLENGGTWVMGVYYS